MQKLCRLTYNILALTFLQNLIVLVNAKTGYLNKQHYGLNKSKNWHLFSSMPKHCKCLYHILLITFAVHNSVLKCYISNQSGYLCSKHLTTIYEYYI